MRYIRRTTPTLEPSPSPSPRLSSIEPAFAPNGADLTPQNSIILPIADAPIYLEISLKALTLHTESRTSFITFVPLPQTQLLSVYRYDSR